MRQATEVAGAQGVRPRRTAWALVTLVLGSSLAAEPVDAAPPALEWTDVSDASGVSAALDDPGDDAYLHTASWGDLDGDGRPDLFTGSFGGALENQLLRNTPGGFTRVAADVVNGQGRASGSVLADLDGDADLDLFVANNRDPNGPSDRHQELNRLYRNDGDELADVSTSSGLQAADEVNRAVGVLDYDGDGKLDLFVVADFFKNSQATSRLFRNLGEMRFEDVTTSAGLDGVKSLGIGVGDLNGDGWPDLFVAGGPTQIVQTNFLFVNNRDGSFRRVGEDLFSWDNTAGAEDWVSGVGFGDVNRDGRLDMVVTHHFGTSAGRGIAVPPRLYLNETDTGAASNPDPRLREVTAMAGIAGVASKAPHAEIQDFDNDGWPDVYLSIRNGAASPWVYRHQGALSPGGEPSFVAPVDEGLTYYPGGPVADYDRDGRLDVFFEEFRPDTPTPVWLVRNTTPDTGNWLDVTVATTENTMGLGAKVEVYRAGASELIGFNEISVGNGYSSSGPALVHFGLGASTTVDLVVRMPFNGEVVRQAAVPVNQRVHVDAIGGGAPDAVVVAAADAHVSAAKPKRNFGASDSLKVRGAEGPGSSGSSGVVAYLKFSVPDGPITSARLRLKVAEGSASGGVVRVVADGAWDERTITFRNAPETGATVGPAIGPVTTGDVVEVDVSGQVSGPGAYSFAVVSDDRDAVHYSSRETSSPPQLILTPGT